MKCVFKESDIAASAQLLATSSKVVILTHMSPDGDAMGSSLGLYHWLKSLPTSPQVNIVVPNAFPSFFNWMPDSQSILLFDKDTTSATDTLQNADLIVCTDFNEPKRIGALGELLLQVIDTTHTPSILIDHHLHPADFAQVVFSYPQSPSASELVYRLIRQWSALPDFPALNQHLSLPSATCIYTGMMTDTGNFSFNSNHSEMYEIVGDLVRIGVDKDYVYDQVFNAYSEDRMRLIGYCLYKKMQIFHEYHAAFISLSRKEMYKFNFRAGDSEGLVNMPMQIKGIYYSCFIREDKVLPAERHLANGSKIKIKISMRSKGDRPVNTFCHDIFSGGGHKNASGGEYYGSLENATNLFMQNYPKYFNK